jgi:hypothetical protein
MSRTSLSFLAPALKQPLLLFSVDHLRPSNPEFLPFFVLSPVTITQLSSMRIVEEFLQRLRAQVQLP